MELNTRRYKVVIAIVLNNTGKVISKEIIVYAKDVLDACSEIKRNYTSDNLEDNSLYFIVSVTPVDPIYGIKINDTDSKYDDWSEPPMGGFHS